MKSLFEKGGKKKRKNKKKKTFVSIRDKRRLKAYSRLRTATRKRFTEKSAALVALTSRWRMFLISLII